MFGGENPFGPNPMNGSSGTESNLRPEVYKTPALPAELRRNLEGRVGIEPTSLHWKRRVRPLNYLPMLAIIAALGACSSQPIVRVQYVPTKVYLPIPAELTLLVTVDMTGMTYGEGLGSLRDGLERCDGRLAAIRVLTPPSPPKNP